MAMNQPRLDNPDDDAELGKTGLHPSDKAPSEEEHLSEYDKALADSFPASDPPVQP